MPANVTVDFARAQEKYENAKTPYEKLAALEEMKSLAPSHKGAENLRAGINRKIALIRNEIEKEKKQSAKKGGGPTLAVKKEGVGQIILVGFPSAGKTSFFNAMTGLNHAVGNYGFTTLKPDVGMVDFRGAKIQLVDMPPLVEGSAEGKGNGRELLAVIRNGDALVIVVEGEHAAEQYDTLSHELKNAGIILNRKKPNVRLTPSSFPGISITGKQYLKIPQEQLVSFLKGQGMYNVQVVLGENTTLDTLAETLNEKLSYKKTLILVIPKGKKIDLPNEKNTKIIIWENTSAQKKELANVLFEILDKVYVYTKKPGEAPAMHLPLVIPQGSTVMNVAGMVHKDIVHHLKNARVWGSTKYDGQRVAKNYRVQNGDIVEFEW